MPTRTEQPPRGGSPLALSIVTVTPESSPRPAKATRGESSKHLNALTGLRFLGSFIVVLYHFGRTATATSFPGLFPFLHGAAFVLQFFFILSGFVLGHTYLTRNLIAREFYAKRLARVYPLYLLALVACAPSFIVQIPHGTLMQGIATAVSAPLLLQSLSPITAMTWNYPAWSVSVEVLFYGLFPVVRKYFLERSVRQSILLVFGFWVTALLPACIYSIVNPDHLAIMDTRSHELFETQEYAGWLGLLLHNPVFHVAEFLSGVALSRIFKSLRPQAVTRVRWLFWPTVCILLAAAYVSGVIPYPIVHNGLMVPALTALILCCSVGDGLVVRFLGSRVFVLLGEASYAIYLLQYPVYLLFKSVYLTFTVGHPLGLLILKTPGLLASYLLLLVMISLAITQWVEPPLISAARLRIAQIFKVKA
ncbi:MAG: acyltransferase [Bryobacteraceae bacterium]